MAFVETDEETDEYYEDPFSPVANLCLVTIDTVANPCYDPQFHSTVAYVEEDEETDEYYEDPSSPVKKKKKNKKDQAHKSRKR